MFTVHEEIILDVASFPGLVWRELGMRLQISTLVESEHIANYAALSRGGVGKL